MLKAWGDAAMQDLRRMAREAGGDLPPGSRGESVFAAMTQQRPDAVLVTGEGDLYAHRALIGELAEKHRLATMSPYRDFVDAGGLMAYTVDLAELLRHMAGQVQQILKGAKPGDVPVYQPTRFQLLINRKTANALGLNLYTASTWAGSSPAHRRLHFLSRIRHNDHPVLRRGTQP